MQALPLGDLSTTPWAVSPLWFALMAILIPVLFWLALAWRHALLECPNRVRRAGLKELRRLLQTLRRFGRPPEAVHLHGWFRATARAWDVRTSAPCVDEVFHAVHTATGDEIVSVRWRELWLLTERGLYAPNAQLTSDWLEQATSAAAAVEMPKRQRIFPNRLRHWLPNRTAKSVRAPRRRRLFLVGLGRVASSLGLALLVVSISSPPAAEADVPWSAPTTTESAPSTSTMEIDKTRSADKMGSADGAAAPDLSPQAAAETAEPLPPEAARAAQAALDSNWNDWAAHHNLAAFETQQGNLNRAIAHATAAFAQHPDPATTRATLLAAIGDTQTVDPTVRRLLFGAWHERVPTLLSPVGWQRLALISGLMAAAGLSVIVFAMYAPRRSQGVAPSHRRAPMSLTWVGRGTFALGGFTLVVALGSWSAYGALNQPTARILVQNANMTPVPTDLVPTEETSPVAAGTVVETRRTFLGWREISKGPESSGWIRSAAVMPVYASR